MHNSGCAETFRPDPKPKTFHSAKYQKWVRTKRCWGCSRRWGIQFHHESALSNENGMSMKCSDKYGIPLCQDCHDIRHKLGPISFWGEDRLKTLPGECAELYKEFLKQEDKP